MTWLSNVNLIINHQKNAETRSQPEMAIFEYINGFYNPRRRHSALG